MNTQDTTPTKFIEDTLRVKFYSLFDGRPLSVVRASEEFKRIEKAYIEVLFLRMIRG